jgi:hypothetical protein
MAEKTYVFPRTHYSDRSPTPTDDANKGFLLGQFFVKQTTGGQVRYICRDNAVGAAIWFRLPDCIDPAEGTSADPQDSVDAAIVERNVFLTPHMMFQDNVISYDLTVNRNAMSVGPITIDTGYTITVETSGNWTIV